MATTNKTPATKPATPAPAAATATPANPPAGPAYKPVLGTITVLKPQATFKGARAAWFAVLVQHNGQAANAYLHACAKAPPSLPASGRAEAPTGWLSWFVRNGYCTVTTGAAPVVQPTGPVQRVTD